MISAVTLDGYSRLISRLFKLQGDPTASRLAAEATRIRLAHTYDPRLWSVYPARSPVPPIGGGLPLHAPPAPPALPILFEAVVHHALARFGPDLAQAAVLREPEGGAERLLWLLVGSVEDGLGQAACLAEADRAAVLALGASQVLGVAAVVPVEESVVIPGHSAEPLMRRSERIEKAAMEYAAAYERSPRWDVDQVSDQAAGCDLLSRGPDS
jgi:hypothetical protein